MSQQITTYLPTFNFQLVSGQAAIFINRITAKFNYRKWNESVAVELTDFGGGIFVITDTTVKSIKNYTGVAIGQFVSDAGLAFQVEALLQVNNNTHNGITTLEGLNDVTITSVADGEVLTYDSGTSKWVNETPDAGASLPIVRYVYLAQDAGDITRMGGSASNVYGTFQAAYDAANTLQVASTGIVVIMVGNISAAVAGDLTLAANYNSNVHICGISNRSSILGDIINTNGSGNNYSLGGIVATNAKFGAIGVMASVGNGGNITLTGNNVIATNLVSSSSAGISGTIQVIGSDISLTSVSSVSFSGSTGSVLISASNTIVQGNVTITKTNGTPTLFSLTNNSSIGGLILTPNGFDIPIFITESKIVSTVTTTNAGLSQAPVLINAYWGGSLYSAYDIAASATLDALAPTIAQGIYSKSVGLTCTAATLTITAITAFNFPDNWPVRFFIATGKTITFQHGAGANAPRCEGGVNAVLVGTNGDWIEFTKINSIICQTNIGQY